MPTLCLKSPKRFRPAPLPISKVPVIKKLFAFLSPFAKLTNMNIDLKKQRELLAEELVLLEEEMATIGRHKPENKADWEAVPPRDINVETSDENELGDMFEEYESNTAVIKQLEIRYNNLKDALDRIDKGTYGVCIICGKEIEEARMAANPAAATCIEHKDSK